MSDTARQAVDSLLHFDAPVTTTFLCDFRIDFSHHELHPTPLGARLTFIVAGGEVRGPQLEGEFLPGGGDWVVIGTDGVARIDVRATIRTHDGALIHVTNTGRAKLSSEATTRFNAGQLVPWDQMYARSSPLFETGADAYGWLNSIHTVAVNQFSLREVHYRVHAVD